MNKLKMLIVAVAVVAMVFPATFVGALTTGVEVASGGGEAPIVKAKWEQEPITELESGDPGHTTPGSQFNPPMVKNAVKPIDYYAVVTDAEDMGNVYEVFSYVYHPTNSPSPYNNANDPDDLYLNGHPEIEGLFKYKVIYAPVPQQDAAALINAANAAGLIKFNSGYDIAELTGPNGEITKGTATLWCGTEVIDYEQPGGDYDVKCIAVDNNNNRSVLLWNSFLYVPMAGIEVDFTGIVYGSVNLGIEKMIAGDWIWSAGLAGAGQNNQATVRNIGNVWAHVTVMQDDMGFGKAGAAPGTALQSPAPLGAASNWNVNFDFRMGSDNQFKLYYDPFVTITSPNFLGLSTIEELDFSILVKNGFGPKTGNITIGATMEPFGPGGIGNAFGPVGQPD